MAHKATSKKLSRTPSPVLAYDLGGTKVAVAVISRQGKILKSTRAPVVFEQGKKAVFDQLVELGKTYLSEFPMIEIVGMGSAGPVDPAAGVLLDPYNFVRNGKHWGVVPMAKILSQRLKRKVYLDNDAAAAMLAEHWVGEAKKCDNAMILTLGTGLGTGFICNGRLLRGRYGLHTEGGHIPIRAGDPTAVCGCGNLGCAEAFISGSGFARRFALKSKSKQISTEEIAALARAKDPIAEAAFQEYAVLLAATIRAFVSLFGPKKVILTGSISFASDLFLEPTREELRRTVMLMTKGINLIPKLELSRLGNDAGVIGAGWIAFHGAGILNY